MTRIADGRLVEAGLAAGLFLGYLVLWRLKRARTQRHAGVDPEVFSQASAPVQAYFARLIRVITGMVIVLLGLHVGAPDRWPPLVRLPVLDGLVYDILGTFLGIAGLALCALAQTTMGTSWRVGIDVQRQTALVTAGVFRWIRNPTYLGLHIMNCGLWLIWPTTLVAFYSLLFFIVMDIQVRCEEEHMLAIHGDCYRDYSARSWRYLPWIY